MGSLGALLLGAFVMAFPDKVLSHQGLIERLNGGPPRPSHTVPVITILSDSQFDTRFAPWHVCI
jgi:hypothetical protein